MWMGPPKALDWPKPISSIRTIRTLGALAGAFTSNRGGGVASRASKTVLWGYWGSGIGRTVRSVGYTTRACAGSWAATGAMVSEASIGSQASDIAATPIRRKQVVLRLVVLLLRLKRMQLSPIAVIPRFRLLYER